MITNDKLEVDVTKVTYVLHADGTVDPYIHFKPTVMLPNNVMLSKIPTWDIDSASDIEIAQGDKICISVSEYNTPLVKIVVPSDQRRFDILPDVCPMCGSPLIQHRCLNRACGAQMYHTVLMLLSALGLSLQGSTLKIIDLLLSGNKINNPADVFLFSWRDVCFDNVSSLEARMFVQYIHSVRSSVSIEQLLRGLNIPNLTDTTIEKIALIFNTNHWSLLDLSQLFSEENRDIYKDIDWSAWNDFISIDSNKVTINRLCSILYI